MRALVHSEWIKTRSTRLPWLLLGAGIAYACVQAVTLAILGAGVLPGVPVAEGLLLEPSYVSTILGQAGTASTFVLLTGVMAMSGEYRHRTISSAYLVTPRRLPVVAAKSAVFAGLGITTALVATAATSTCAMLALMPFDHAPVTLAAISRVASGAAIGLALYGILGVCLGSLITNQVAAVTATLLWAMLVEPLVSVAFPAVAAWLPGGALNAALGVGMRADMTGAMTAADPLPGWAGALLLLGYAFAVAAIASRTTLRRDIG